jgi:hypothetical protein
VNSKHMLADVNLAAEVTYTPTGGEPSTEQKKLKLVRCR